jgi:hypothetical protein
VLEGSIVMQVKGGKEVTLTPGQTFYESPKHVHVVSRNTSSTKPAKFLVLFLKDKSAPLLLPANQLRNSAAADITDLRTATRMQEHLCRYERTT